MKRFLLFFGLALMAASAEAMPQGWWTNKTGQDILRQAQAVTDNTPYLHGEKSHDFFNQDYGYEYFKRKTQSGDIETKTVLLNNRRAFATLFDLKDGRYQVNFSVLTKNDYDDGPRIEDRLGKVLGDQAFTFDVTGEAVVGTNDCLVISRTMTTSLSNAVVQTIIKEMNMTNLTSYPPVREYYVRKADAIILGYVAKGASGQVESDELCDSMTADPIPDSEFRVPWEFAAITATNSDAYPRAMTQGLQRKTFLDKGRSVAFALGIIGLASMISWVCLKFFGNPGRKSV